ncbi:MAG: nitroreductase family deazaflavin-dependent oxidoreductase [Chloroflexi bacterium]|nr:nitroreductase family deazaflavin-dependent oxidoreductase [Chloroflexota bacterium]
MPEKIKEVTPPRGFSRFLYRLPIWLYKWHMGWLLGGRFLLLNHVGRKSGQPRQVVLEVAGHDETTDTYYVASGFGPTSQWFQNIQQTTAVTIQVGRKKMAVTARILSPEESGQTMVRYAQAHPKAAKNLMKVCGYRVDGSDEDYFVMGSAHIPFVAFTPRQAGR